MSIIIDGTGTISGVSATGLTTAQNVASAQLPTGTVLQVVNATYSTAVSSANSTPITTGLTASITPKFSTSKIVVMVNQNVRTIGGGVIQLDLFKNGSAIYRVINAYTYNSAGTGTVSTIYTESPASTSAITYAMYFNNANTTSTVYVQADNNPSEMIIMEIAG